MKQSFALEEQIQLTDLGLELHIYRNSSGLSHLHLDTADQHRACAIGFRTTVEDDSGVAHALEHSVLCGSKQFPVRDPFFMMLRRSMQTFMNAMTGSDCTWYPFSTQNEQDFYNLFDVYVDSVFNPNLHELDIAQEAHRYSPGENDSFIHNGVVYNEMKGDSSDIDSILYQALCKHLLPGTPYERNTGGDPFVIPQLNAETLRNFHTQKYHAANACIATYGALDIPTLHNKLLAYEFTQKAADDAPSLIQANNTRSTHSIPIPISEDDAQEESGHLIIAYLWGDAADPIESLVGDVCEELLIGHAASPLRHALEPSGLCQSIEGSGYWDYCRNGMFSVEAHGCDPSNYERIEQLILTTLNAICENGFSESEIRDAINQVEMQERYIGGEQEPFGLQLCEQLLDAWNYHISPQTMIDTNYCFKKLKELYGEHTQALNELISSRLLKEFQTVILKTTGKADYHQTLHQHEEKLLDALSDNARSQYCKQEQSLKERQQKPDDPNILPMVSVNDIAKHYPLEHYQSGYMPCLSNGLTLLHASTPIQFTQDNDHHASLSLTRLISEVGFKHFDYQQSGKLLHQHFGNISSSIDTWMDAGSLHASLCTSAWGLSSNLDEMQATFIDYLTNLRLDEQERLGELCDQSLHAHKEQFVSHGTKYAALSSQAGCSAIAQLRNAQTGFPHYQYLLNAKSDIKQFQAQVHDFYQSIHWKETALHVAQQQEPRSLHAWSKNSLPSQQSPVNHTSSPPFQAFIINATIHHCACAVPAPAFDHHYAPSLAVIGHLMTNTFLHTRLREQQGAYGASAFYNPSLETFVLTSYRDPGLDASIATMQDAFEFLQTHTFNQNEIDEAIISAVAEFDKPSSPFGNIKRRIQMERHKLSEADWQEYRRKLLTVTKEDIKEAARIIADLEQSRICALGPEESFKNSSYAWHIERPLTWQ